MDESTNGQITKEIFQEDEDQETLSGIGFFNWLASAGEIIPPWWSYARDEVLRRFWKSEDHLSGSINTLREMMVAIPVKVLPRDSTIKAHIRQAEYYTSLLLNQTISRSNPAAQGWGSGYGPFLEDYWTQDNGGFLAIEGPGRPDGPIIGAPTKIIHLDAWRCYRTRRREYPVIYYDTDGKRYKLHKSRVISFASQSSPIAEMCGVGFCAVSRAIYAAQVMRDIAIYKQEKLGSRQKRAILIGDGIPTKAIENALKLGEEAMNNMQIRRFGKIPIIGSTKQGVSLTLVDLASLPDGFDDIDQHQLGMHVLALALGVDVRQLGWAMGVSGQTKADALVQHFKMRGKGPGYIIREITRQFEIKVLPPHLKLVFDRQDDEEDEQQANIESTRSQIRERDIKNEVITVRVAREQMIEEGGLTAQQFEQLELQDGRLPDGQPLQSIMMNPRYFKLIDLGVADLYQLHERGGLSSQLQLIRQVIAFKEQEAEEVSMDIQDSEVELKSLKTYGQEVTKHITAFWNRQITKAQFRQRMSDSIQTEFNSAFLDGVRQCDPEADEITPQMRRYLNKRIEQEFSFIPELANDISPNKPLEKFLTRGNLWIRRFDEVQIRARLMACPDELFEWTLGPTEHCPSCLALGGFVLTGREWLDSGVLPQVSNATYLDCQGFNCACDLRRTNKPRSSEPLPVRAPGRI